MSQENVEIIRRLLLAYVRQDYEASITALDDAVELSADPRANMETGLVRGREAVVASIGGFILSFDNYWCEEPEELIDVGDWVIVVVRSGGRGRTSGVPVSQVWTVAYKLRRGRIVRIEFHPDKGEAMASIEAAGLRESAPEAHDQFTASSASPSSSAVRPAELSANTSSSPMKLRSSQPRSTRWALKTLEADGSPAFAGVREAIRQALEGRRSTATRGQTATARCRSMRIASTHVRGHPDIRPHQALRRDAGTRLPRSHRPRG